MFKIIYACRYLLNRFRSCQEAKWSFVFVKEGLCTVQPLLRSLLELKVQSFVCQFRNVITVNIHITKFLEKKKPANDRRKTKTTLFSTGEMTSKYDERFTENCSHFKIRTKNLVRSNIPSKSNALKIFRKSQEVSFVFPWK